MTIRKLPTLLVNQIAAGEVIERPASVVKELMENALDAGATFIDVAAEEGGCQLIRVSDNGGGIAPQELPLAVAAHATSKLQTAADLAAIGTLGFRGEALASIAAVSRMRITSRRPDVESGAQLESSGDQTSEVEPAACAPGTTLEVRNLFFNTPARRKFLRAESAEFTWVADTFARIALAYPSVGFKLTHGGRTRYDLPPNQTARQRCVEILGREIEQELLEFSTFDRGVEIWGLAGMPAVAKTTVKYQYVYVNGRAVRDRSIQHAIKEAYRGLIDPTRQPLVVLFITLDPTLVDVNVHPTKAEVRFADPNVIHGQVLSALRQRLLAADLTPAVQGFRPGEGFPVHRAGDSIPGAYGRAAGPGQQGFSGGGSMGFGAGTGQSAPWPGATGGVAGGIPAALGAGDGDAPSAGALPGNLDANSYHAAASFVDYFRRMDPRQKGFVYQQVRQDMAELMGDSGQAAGDGGAGGPQELLRPMQGARPILQVHNSYLVTQDEQGILIIDQHALHERMMFQELLERINASGHLESQRLLTPAMLKATPGRMEALERLKPLLDRIGIEASPMGPGVIGIHAFPTLLFDRNVDPEEFLDDLLGKAEEQTINPSQEAALHEVLDMMSCKAAVKAGDRLADGELEALMTRRQEIDRASNCPHGRPTTVRLTLQDLEKHFKRS